MDISNDLEYAQLAQDDWSIRDDAMRAYVARSTEEVASLVRSTLGPCGMEKQILTRAPEGPVETVQSADSSEILDAIERGEGFNHPIAALFVDAVDSMQRGLGDGSTSAILLTHLLVKEGIELIEDGVNPNTVAFGYAAAADRAGEILDELSRPIDETGEQLRQVAITSMAGQLDHSESVRLVDYIVDAVQGVAMETEWINTDNVKIITTRQHPDALYRGVVIRQRPKMLEESEKSRREFDWSLQFPDAERDLTVAIIDSEVDFEKTASTFETGSETDKGGASTVHSVEELREYQDDLDATIEAAARDLSEMGVDLLAAQPTVSDGFRNTLGRRGIRVLDQIDSPLSDVERLSRATGASIVSDLADLRLDQLGTAGSVSQQKVGDEKWTCVDECQGGVFTIVSRCETETEVARRERLVADAIEVAAVAARDGQVLPGAGAPAMAVASVLRGERDAVPGRLQLPFGAFAESLEAFVQILAKNCGHDPLDVVPRLRAAHSGAEQRPAPIGLDVETGAPVNAWEAGIIEPRRIFSQAAETARVTSEQLLTMDAALFPDVDFEAFTPETEHD